MSAIAPIDEHESVNQLMSKIRQGDCFLGVGDFVWLGFLPEGGPEIVSREVPGFAVLTQTCDVVRRVQERPVIEVAPLVAVDASVVKEVAARKRPNYAYVPALATQNLVVDIDRTMTVEKTVLSQWPVAGTLANDKEIRDFQASLARKRQRFAFPDDFNALVKPLQKRLTEKHDKESPEGRALRALEEIRVLAEPFWDATSVTLTFYFIVSPDHPPVFEGRKWTDWSTEWLGKLVKVPRFADVSALTCELAELSAPEYLQSDMLDLDRLSAD